MAVDAGIEQNVEKNLVRLLVIVLELIEKPDGSLEIFALVFVADTFKQS